MHRTAGIFFLRVIDGLRTELSKRERLPPTEYKSAGGLRQNSWRYFLRRAVQLTTTVIGVGAVSARWRMRKRWPADAQRVVEVEVPAKGNFGRQTLWEECGSRKPAHSRHDAANRSYVFIRFRIPDGNSLKNDSASEG